MHSAIKTVTVFVILRFVWDFMRGFVQGLRDGWEYNRRYEEILERKIEEELASRTTVREPVLNMDDVMDPDWMNEKRGDAYVSCV